MVIDIIVTGNIGVARVMVIIATTGIDVIATVTGIAPVGTVGIERESSHV
jgi:hypothetical protein